MILLIDNYDSFTYNLYQQVARFDLSVRVVPHDKMTLSDIQAMQPEKIIISPGPGRPETSGISRNVIHTFYQSIPILGVCLGHECIGVVFGASVVHAKRVMHGKTSPVFHIGEGLFRGIPQPFRAARYHSLVIDRVPEAFRQTAWTEDGEIMGIAHTLYPLYGVQFHPESFLTEAGDRLMQTFLYDTHSSHPSITH